LVTVVFFLKKRINFPKKTGLATLEAKYYDYYILLAHQDKVKVIQKMLSHWRIRMKINHYENPVYQWYLSIHIIVNTIMNTKATMSVIIKIC